MSAAEIISTERMAEMVKEYPEELRMLLDEAAERGAARAVKLLKTTRRKPSEWMTKEEALEYMAVSYHTLNRYVNAGYIRKNDGGKHGRKYYHRQDVVDYVAGKREKKNFNP